MPVIKNSLPSKKFQPTIIQLKSNDNESLAGKIYNPHCSDGKCFQNLTQMILLINDLLGEVKYPQNTVEFRSFNRNSESDKTKISTININNEDISEESDVSTFKLNIMFRQNADWQGEISWVDTNTGKSFKSVLELITILDEELKGKKAINNPAK